MLSFDIVDVSMVESTLIHFPKKQVLKILVIQHYFSSCTVIDVRTNLLSNTVSIVELKAALTTCK